MRRGERARTVKERLICLLSCGLGETARDTHSLHFIALRQSSSAVDSPDENGSAWTWSSRRGGQIGRSCRRFCGHRARRGHYRRALGGVWETKVIDLFLNGNARPIPTPFAIPPILLFT